MLFNLTDAISQQFTPIFISKVSSYIGETEIPVSKALTGVLPTVLGAITNRTSAGEKGADEFFSVAKDSYEAGIIHRTDDFFTDGGVMMNKGLSLAYGFMGDNIPALINSISNFAGIKKSSAGSLFSIVAPMVAATTGKYAADNNLAAADIASLFNGQQARIISTIPVRLDSVISILGLTNTQKEIPSFSSDINGSSGKILQFDKPRKKFGWLTWLFIPAAASAVIWWLGIASCNSAAKEKITSVTDSVIRIEAPGKKL